MYTYEEALNSSIEYFDGDELAAKVFVDKYALRNKEGELLESTPKHMHKRLSKELARIDASKFLDPVKESEYFDDLDRFNRIVLQGGPMYGIGNKYQYVSLGNCFVIPPPNDSYSGIMYTDTQITQISCRRGGVGWDVSKLRPKDMAVQNAAKSTTGAVSFVKRFSNTIREVAQNGRRAASLQSISCLHPDVLEFIKCKRDRTEVTGSNISIQFTDKFMKSVEENKEITLKWPLSGQAQIKKTVKASEIWNEFVKGAHADAEPGCMFIDRVHKMSPGVPYGHIETSSNPCGEQFLPEYASCRLLLLNLLGYVKNKYTDEAFFDFDLFKKDVHKLVRIGDNLVDLEIESINRIIKKIESDPESESIKKISLDLWENVKRVAIEDRRMGCGFTALGDCLASLGLKYDSDEAISFASKMQETYAIEAYRQSVELAKKLDPFPLFDKKLDCESGFVKQIKRKDRQLYEDMMKYGRRNMVLLTIAPTGSVSCLTRTSSGLEPVFMLDYTRRKKGNPGDKGFKVDFVDQNGDQWMHFVVKHKGLQDWIDKNPKKEIKDSPYYNCTANDINWEKRIKLQAGLQKWIDNSISVTVNLPEDTTIETISKIYFEAWRHKCKGVTIYREGSRTGVLVDSSKTIAKTITQRPDDLPCEVHHITVKGNPYFVLVGIVGDKPYEVFAGRNGMIHPDVKTGVIHKVKRPKCYRVQFEDDSRLQPITAACTDNEEALTRMISMSLRNGAEIQYVVDQLQKTQGVMTSLSKAIARALKKYIPEGVESSQKCPDCDTSLVFNSGCCACVQCGYSACN
jgi:ribonucleoside-diphosphate reductase alpha chain